MNSMYKFGDYYNPDGSPRCVDTTGIVSIRNQQADDQHAEDNSRRWPSIEALISEIELSDPSANSTTASIDDSVLDLSRIITETTGSVSKPQTDSPLKNMPPEALFEVLRGIVAPSKDQQPMICEREFVDTVQKWISTPASYLRDIKSAVFYNYKCMITSQSAQERSSSEKHGSKSPDKVDCEWNSQRKDELNDHYQCSLWLASDRVKHPTSYFQKHVIENNIQEHIREAVKVPAPLENLFLSYDEDTSYTLPIEKDVLNYSFCEYSKHVLLDYRESHGYEQKQQNQLKFFRNLGSPNNNNGRSLHEMLYQFGSGNAEFALEEDKWFLEKITGISMVLELYNYAVSEQNSRSDVIELCKNIIEQLAACEPVHMRMRLAHSIVEWLYNYRKRIEDFDHRKRAGIFDTKEIENFIADIKNMVSDINRNYEGLLHFVTSKIEAEVCPVPQESDFANLGSKDIVERGCFVVYNSKALLNAMENYPGRTSPYKTKATSNNDVKALYSELQQCAIQRIFELYDIRIR